MTVFSLTPLYLFTAPYPTTAPTDHIPNPVSLRLPASLVACAPSGSWPPPRASGASSED
ncbi:hypothetical protein B484DRAFT_453228 [Ochromonadaceae sp. CCMP2298]|nr:hypothetical protein B484DRAFT_453228 [Ochromonadaceae sp. CCMP2298]